MKIGQLATRCGASYGHLHNIEHGRKRPSIELLNRIARELKVSVDELIDHNQTPQEPTKVQAAAR